MKLLLPVLLTVLTIPLCAQVQYGKIDYTRSREMVLDNYTDKVTAQDKKVREMVQQMSAAGAFNKYFVATFGPDGFLCAEKEKEAAEMTTELGNGNRITIMTGDEEPVSYYTNTVTGEVTNSDLIYDKKFLVTGKPAKLEWVLTGEKVPPSEATAGLDLLLATAVNAKGDTVTAGYAPSLPIQVGPMNYYGLPGAIITLEIPMGKEKLVYRATGIEVSPTALPIELPAEGKPIGYQKFMEQKQKKQETAKRTRRTITRN